MNSFDICLKEADIAYMEACDALSIFADSCEIEMYTEEGQSESIFQKCKKKIKNLLDKIIEFIRNFCSSDRLKNNIHKLDTMKQCELIKMKCEILDENKKKSFIKKYSDRIKKAQSADEVNAIMGEYKKKKNITKFTVVVSGVVLLGILRQINVNKKVNEANKAYDEYVKSVDVYEQQLKKMQNKVSNDTSLKNDRRKQYDTFFKTIDSMTDPISDKFSNLTRADRNRIKARNDNKIKYDYSDIRAVNSKLSALTELHADILNMPRALVDYRPIKNYDKRTDNLQFIHDITKK